MLKHKLKKTSKKLQTLTGGSKEGRREKTGKNVTYEEANHRHRKEKNVGPGTNSPYGDGGYYTATESLYESSVSDKKRSQSEGRTQKKIQSEPIVAQNYTDQKDSLNDSGTHESLVPVGVSWHRRATPEEDMVWTLHGIENLLETQKSLIASLANNYNKLTDEQSSPEESKHSAKEGEHTKDKDEFVLPRVKLGGGKRVGREVRKGSPTSMSSMQTLRRLLEVEELRNFSDQLEKKIKMRKLSM